MTTYAVVQTGGKQYRVRAGDVLKVERLEAEAGETLALEDVRLVAQDGTVQVGRPTVAGAQVVAEVEAHGKRDKIVVMKFKSKVRYRVKRGHRQWYTQLRIKDIVTEGSGDGA